MTEKKYVNCPYCNYKHIDEKIVAIHLWHWHVMKKELISKNAIKSLINLKKE